MDRSWIMNPNHVDLEYINGLNQFLDFAKNYMITENLAKIRCPCRECRNLLKFEFDHVRGHLYRWGFDKLYRVWTFHGETNRPINEVGSMNVEEGVEHLSDSDEDSFFDMLDDLRDARIADGSGVVANDDSETTSTKGAEETSRESFMSMFEEARRELYPGCTTFSAFSFVVKLMHLKVLNGWSNKSFDMLLELLEKAFPKPNAIPCSHYEARKMLKELGLGYESIHACKNDCILFWDEHKDNDICPICEEPRFKYNEAKKKNIPHKVLRYFPWENHRR